MSAAEPGQENSAGSQGQRLARRVPFFWRSSVLCLPAIPLLLLGGDLWHQSVNSVIAAGAALSVGFGASRSLRGKRWGAMLAASLGMAAAAVIGSLAGQSMWLLLPCAALGAAGCAALALIDEDLWWVALQVVIAMLVAGYFPSGLLPALERAGFTLAGGAVQVVCVVLLATLFPQMGVPLPPGPPRPVASPTEIAAHAGRAGLCVALALALTHALQLDHGYWAWMTALLVIKPGLLETHTRGVARLAGTVAGCAVATLFVFAVHDQWIALVMGLGLSASATFGLQRAQYGAMTAGVTATVVLLNSLAGAGAVAIAGHRLLATLVGGLTALLVAWVFRRRDA